MNYEEHLIALRRESAALAEAAATCLASDVASCPGWTVERLLGHVGDGFRRVARIVRDHADAEVDLGGVPAPGDDVVAWYEESAAELVDAFANEPPETPVWNWSGEPGDVAWWARRMAHEVAVHRWDVTPAPVEAAAAADGVDEALTLFLPYSLARRPVDGLAGTFAVRCDDTGDAWFGTLRPDSVSLVRGVPAGVPEASLHGPASDLLLALWGRPVPVEAAGDPRIVAVLTA
ncbi:MAG TPA: maleylpyruvate isomerase family mycothiol-dependent enzyme [Mycobacteriales bacterium]|jgi:uncharacterized protein (TIGR03083 family)